MQYFSADIIVFRSSIHFIILLLASSSITWSSMISFDRDQKKLEREKYEIKQNTRRGFQTLKLFFQTKDF